VPKRRGRLILVLSLTRQTAVSSPHMRVTFGHSSMKRRARPQVRAHLSSLSLIRIYLRGGGRKTRARAGPRTPFVAYVRGALCTGRPGPRTPFVTFIDTDIFTGWRAKDARARRSAHAYRRIRTRRSVYEAPRSVHTDALHAPGQQSCRYCAPTDRRLFRTLITDALHAPGSSRVRCGEASPRRPVRVCVSV
jgi:hypothetical protein